MPCNPAELAEVQLFQLLDENELAELASVIDSKTVGAGEIIFNAGEFGDALYIVRSGEVELSVKDTAGQKIVLTNVDKHAVGRRIISAGGTIPIACLGRWGSYNWGNIRRHCNYRHRRSVHIYELIS